MSGLIGTYCLPDIAPVNSVHFSHVHTFASIASQPEREGGWRRNETTGFDTRNVSQRDVR